MYKKCLVPLCLNTSKQSPNCIFFRLPNDIAMILRWFRAAGINPAILSKLKQGYFCEKHFDLDNDLTFPYYSFTTRILKHNVVPRYFRDLAVILANTRQDVENNLTGITEANSEEEMAEVEIDSDGSIRFISSDTESEFS